mgnify:CR=1 FL=1
MKAQTIDRLYEMNLTGMAKSFEKRHQQPDHQDLSFDDFFSLLVEDEYVYRLNNRQKRLLQQAKFKYPSACLEALDYHQGRHLIKTQIVNLQNTKWIDKHQNILITGSTGVGKSYLACAFGTWACRQGYGAHYYRWPRLFGDMLAARGEGTYLQYLKKLAKCPVLIIDDFGLGSLTPDDAKDFLEIVEDRYMAGSTIISSQLPLNQWHSYLADPTIADAVCDRLFHVAYKFELKGGSMRKNEIENS